tara:strand:+ start:850 stop:1071 length:222 start_codon:yes stop_codon:yes gene_type:complete
MIKLVNMNKKEIRQFEVQSAMSTLQRAEEIKKDSRLMGDVKKAAMAEVKKLQSLAGSSSSKKTVSRKKTLKKK